MSHLIDKINQHRSKVINKSGKSTSNTNAQSRAEGDSRLHRSQCITNTPIVAGTFTLLIIFASGLLGLPGLPKIPGLSIGTNNASAITLTIVSGTEDQKINIPPTAEGKFVASDVTTAKVVSDHAAGYTLTVSATALTDGTNTISTLDFGTSINADAFSSASNTQYNNKWGYLPATYYNGTTTITNNTNFFPAPIGDDNMATLDSTTAATPTGGTEYNISVGARIDNTAIQGSYESVFTFAVVGKVTPYSITYNDPSGEATNMPAPNPLTGNVDENTSTVDLSSTVPTRDGYTFKGWCSVSTSDDSCSETTYNPDGGGTNLAFPIDLTSYNNTYTIYAMWASSGGSSTCTTPVPGVASMQAFASLTSAEKTTVMNNITQDAEYGIKDTRDGKTYCVAKLQDGHIWMTQNLDLDLSTGTELKHADTDLGWGADTATTTWTPARDTINAVTDASTKGSITGWTNDDNTPYSVDPGDWYWKGKTFYASSKCQGNSYRACNYITKAYSTHSTYFTTDVDDSGVNGSHGHVGNYYNWSAAVASNSTSRYSSDAVSNIAKNPQNSICPAGWRLPTVYGTSATNAKTNTDAKNEFRMLNGLYNSNSTSTSQGLEASPLFLVRAGNVNGGSLNFAGYYANYWSSTVGSSSIAYYLYFSSTDVYPAVNNNRNFGFSVRCLVR